jgi:hypothetical protein
MASGDTKLSICSDALILLGASPLSSFSEGTDAAQPISHGWEIIGSKLQTNEEDIWVDYQFAPGESLLPTYFVQLLKYAMAAEIAEAVTDQLTKAE